MPAPGANGRDASLDVPLKPDLDAPTREALLRLRDEFLFVPIHHQIRPSAMKPGVSTLHRSNDTFEARFTTLH
jgi:peptide/nickel transport system substrate-binding protein